MKKDIICWWSGGITSAVACKIAIDLFGLDRCRIIMIDTQNEDSDTYRFFKDCEKWYGTYIEVWSAIRVNRLNHKNFKYINIGVDYDSIEDVWNHWNSLNVATGAICSTELKRQVRERGQHEFEYTHQVFGFEFDKGEFNRARSLSKNHKDSKGIYPLLMFGYDKQKCIEIVQSSGIEIPRSYKLGFKNNNCLNTGCVQGGIGYWKKMQRDFPDKFNAMADLEHKLTESRGEPVTMLKDQSGEVKQKVEKTGNKKLQLVFLKKNPKYPELKCLDEMKDREVKPLFECNGFCGTNDLNPRVETEKEINFDTAWQDS